MSLEFKHFNLEIKEVTEQGTFKGIASPFNNVDYGNDRVLPSVAKRNNGKTVPYLWQHDTEEPIGQVNLIATNKGIEFEGKLFLDTNEQGIPLIPKAHKAYVLMKNKQLKNSIGYIVEKYKYTTEGKETIRNLEDIDIKEVSAVTFPMNDKATITDVKKEGGNEVELKEKVDILEQKLNEVLKVLEPEQKKQEEQGKINDVLKYVKSITDKKILMQIKNIVDNMLKEDEKTDNKQEKEKNDTIEMKSDDYKALEQLYKNIVGNKEEK